jgi:hypothetical protein
MSLSRHDVVLLLLSHRLECMMGSHRQGCKDNVTSIAWEHARIGCSMKCLTGGLDELMGSGKTTLILVRLCPSYQTKNKDHPTL